MLRRIFFGFFFVLVVAGDSTANAQVKGNLIAGKQVEADTKLAIGTKLVGVYEKKNYLVEVLENQANKNVRILWIESKEESDQVPQNTLYYIGESAQTRKSRTAALPEAYRAFDKNGDGQIGLYEWDRAKYAEFRKLDKNHDGFLTPQELAVKGSATAATPAVSVPAATTTPATTTPATTTPTTDAAATKSPT